MTFQIHPLPRAQFAPLFALSVADLALRHIRRVTADTCPGFPCRVSLEDATPGEDVLLLNHQHLDGPGPYAASHAIYVRTTAPEARIAPGIVPHVLASRLLSVRAFDADQMMMTADVVAGTDLAPALDAMFADPRNAFVHIHNAKQGCYAARATRA